MVNKFMLEKIQSIYMPTVESVQPFDDEYDESLESYSEEDLDLLECELHDEMIASQEAITPELCNLEATIVLESVGLSLAEFNEYNGRLSMAGVKEAAMEAKVTADSAKKSILQRIIGLFWTVIDNIAFSHSKLMKYAKLLDKYRRQLRDRNYTSPEKEEKVKLYQTNVTELVKLMNENGKIFDKFKEHASYDGKGLSAATLMSYVYRVFSGIGVTINTSTDKIASQFEEKLKNIKETSGGSQKEVVLSATSKNDVLSNSDEVIKAMEGIRFKAFRENYKKYKSKVQNAIKGELDNTNENTAKKAIQADLDRCIILFSSYKKYSKAFTTHALNSIKEILKDMATLLDSKSFGKKKDAEKKEETK